MVALIAQAPDERGDRRAREGVVRVEAVEAELAFRDSGQHRELGPHRIGAPARDVEPAEGPSAFATRVEAGQQTLRDKRRQPAGVEKRLALHEDEGHPRLQMRPPERGCRWGSMTSPSCGTLGPRNHPVDEDHRKGTERLSVAEWLAGGTKLPQRCGRDA